MSLFCWSGRDTAKREEELQKPEPKGLELVINESHIEVKYNGEFIGSMIKDGDIHEFHPNLYIHNGYDSRLLITIAAKLDELNGVE